MKTKIGGPLVAGALVFLSSSPAQAGPWTMEKGQGRLITSLIYSHASKTFGNDGDPAPAADYDQQMAYFLTEYGITDDVTLVANPGLRRIKIEGVGTSSGLAPSEFGVRYRLFHNDRSVISAQVSGFTPGSTRSVRIAQIGTNDWQAEARLLAGTSFKLGKADAFASAEAGYRLRTGAPPNEFHIDAAIGARASQRVLLIANSFNTVSNGSGSGGYRAYRYNNLYAGAVVDVTPALSIQLGGLGTVAGRNALRERGLYAGFWLKF